MRILFSTHFWKLRKHTDKVQQGSKEGEDSLSYFSAANFLHSVNEENKPLLSALKALVPLPWGSTHGACERPCLQQLSYWVLRSNIRMLKGHRHLVLSRCKMGRQGTSWSLNWPRN